MTRSRPRRTPSHVVGIGASAGGLDAIERFFDNVPKTTGMAFVVVQHLSPDFKSLMDELLARHTELPIRLVEDGMPVEADHVYLIPPNTEMIVSDGRLLLTQRSRQQELHLPIDVFFRSLARDCGTTAVAIVLSGGGSDGSRGVRDVHEAGGLVVVQDVESAQFDGMPKTARDAGVADWVLPPEEMPRVILEHASKESPSPVGRATSEPKGIGAVYRMLQEEFGLDFTVYKPSTVTRRIERRLSLAHSPDVEEYVQRLKSERSELDVLYRDLLIGVTRFFRDQEAFDLLENKVLPELLERTPRDQPLRIWVAGCATGEEAYSFAIVLQDLMLKLGERPIKIFATDVHRGSIERASQALYDEEALANVSPARLQRYFLRSGGVYQLVPDLRKMIVFAAHNVIKDAPFTRVDLISCRNLLIYLQTPAQQKVLSLFHFALNRGGVLVLGPSESVGPLARDFESLDKHWRIYRKHTDVSVSADRRMQPLAPTDVRAFATAPAQPRHSVTQLLGTYDALLDDVMPPSLLVTERGELVHAFAGASKFLRPRDGRHSAEVLDLVDPELRMVLVGGLKRALSDPTGLVFNGVRLTTDGATATYEIGLRRVQGKSGGPPHVLVTLEPTEAAAEEAAPKKTEVDLDDVSREQIGALETELSHTRENLQAAIEELEASNEELQASNEELHASNEELQSTNEELQSVNEELYTVNAEYQRKIAELTEITNDMDNLLSSTDIGTVFLDRELRIRKFTPQVADTFNLVLHDVGRPIGTFANKMEHPELVDDLKRVLETGAPVERELRDVQKKSFFLRILPYRAKGAVAGVVLTLIDVSGLKAAEDALFHERYLLNSLLFTVPDAIYFKDARGKFIRANHAMAARLGLADPREAAGKTAFEVAAPEAAMALNREDDTVLRTGEPQHYRLEKRVLPSGREEWALVSRMPLRDAQGGIVGVTVIFRDVTEQKHSEEKIQEAVRRRDQFLAMLSHELRNPLGAIVTATALLKADGAAPQPPARLLEIVDRQSRQMARLLDDLLEASRVTQDKIELRKSVVDLGAVAREAAEAARGLAESRGLALAVDIEPGPTNVHGDPARLQQIQMNLLSNALKYTPTGGHVSLSVQREGGEAVIRVQDDGEGIAADMLDSVFDLFVQSHRTLDRSGGGLGVGLTLVRALVRAHGGEVVAYSKGEKKGSEFVVRLPLTAERAVDEPWVRRVRGPVRAGASIVVVEDSADSREMLCELLASAGFACHTADSGPSAIELVDRVRPDIALLDVGLPGMNGFEVARHIRRDPSHARMMLIALTGYGRAADRAAAREAGFDEHLVKPVDVERLLRLLTTMQDGVPPSPARGQDGALAREAREDGGLT
jgi:two-component system, chemotaxis family, CheB/CheR fusion protein